MDVRAALGVVARIPLRVWAVLGAVYALALLAVRPAVEALLSRAAVVAGVEAVSPDSFPALLASPGSWLLGAAALVTAVTVALVWTALAFAVAMSARAGVPTLRHVAASSAAVVRRWARSGAVLLAVPLVLLTPLAGVGVFSPLSDDLAVPPFIAREFLKAPLSGLLWVAAMAAIVLASFAVLLLLARSAGGPRPGRRSRLDVRASLLSVRGPAAVVAIVALAGGLLPSNGTVLSALVAIGGSIAITVSFVVPRREPSARLVAPTRTMAPTTAWSVARSVAVVASGVVALTISGTVVAPAASSEGERDDPLVIAHRGYDRGGPENTISGLEAAARRGADVVEVDIQQTADGDFVAAHDTNLLVLAGVDRNIHDMTTAELTRTTVSMHGRSDTIPTMEDYVRRAHELGMPLLIEFKITGHETPDVIDRALRRLDALGALDGRDAFHSLDLETVRTLERLRPELRVGLTLAMYSGELPRIGADFFVVEQASITAEMIDDAHSRGAPLYAWTVNDDLDILTLRGLGVDGIVTDRIDSPALADDRATG